MDVATNRPSLDTEVECFINSVIVDVLCDLEQRSQKDKILDNSCVNTCKMSSGGNNSIVSPACSVPSLGSLASDVVRETQRGQSSFDGKGILRFMGSGSEPSSTSACSLSPSFSEFSATSTAHVDGCSGRCHTAEKVEETSEHIPGVHRQVGNDDVMRRQLAEAFGEGYQAATRAGVAGSEQEQIIAVQEKMLSRLCEERDHAETVLQMREQEWHSISDRLVAEIKDVRSAYSKLISECAHENVRLSTHAYQTMFRALHTNDKALSTSVELQMKINEQKLHLFHQERYITRLERRVVDLEERLTTLLQDSGCGDEPVADHDVLMYDRARYMPGMGSDPHLDIIKNFEIGGTSDPRKTDQPNNEDELVSP